MLEAIAEIMFEVWMLVLESVIPLIGEATLRLTSGFDSALSSRTIVILYHRLVPLTAVVSLTYSYPDPRSCSILLHL